MTAPLTFALLALLAGPPPGPAAGSAWAKSLFAELGHDWGKVERGVQLSHQFSLSNRSAETVRIRQLVTSCRCTTAMLSAYEIKPGEQAILDVQMDTAAFRGSKAVSVTVSFDRPRYAEVSLRVVATSGALVPSEPEVDLGRVLLGQAASAQRDVTLTGEPGWKLTAIDFASGSLKATAAETARDGGSVTYRLTVRLEGDAPAGAFRDVIRLHTSRRDRPLVEVPVSATVEPPLRASPDLVTVAGDRETVATVVLRAPEPFRVTRVEGLDPNRLSARGGTAAKAVQVMLLRLSVPAGEPLPERLVFRTDLPGSPTAEIRLVR